LVLTVPFEQILVNISLKVGKQLQIHQANDQTVMVTISGLSESDVTLDANHPMA